MHGICVCVYDDCANMHGRAFVQVRVLSAPMLGSWDLNLKNVGGKLDMGRLCEYLSSKKFESKVVKVTHVCICVLEQLLNSIRLPGFWAAFLVRAFLLLAKYMASAHVCIKIVLTIHVVWQVCICARIEVLLKKDPHEVETAL
jgi:hypothetical protein